MITIIIMHNLTLGVRLLVPVSVIVTQSHILSVSLTVWVWVLPHSHCDCYSTYQTPTV